MSSRKLNSIYRVPKIFQEVFLYLLGFYILINIVFLYVLSSPIFLFRLFVRKLAKNIRPDLANIVNPQGNLFSSELLSSNPPRSCLVVPIVFQGHFTLAEFQSRFTNMVTLTEDSTGKVVYPEYRQYIENWLGFSFWKNDPYFDINNHVKPCTFTTWQSDLATSEKDISNFIEELLNKHFQRERSPWEVYVANNYIDAEYPDGVKTIIIVRLHHTLADGFSLLYSLIEGVVQSNLGSVELPKPVYSKWEGIFNGIVFPIKLARDIGGYFVKGIRKSVFRSADNKKLWKQVYSKSKSIPVREIKEIKDKLKVTFSSVLLAAVAAGLSEWRKRKIREQANGSECDFTDREAFFFVLPLPGHPRALTNHMTGAQVDLAMKSFPDPVLRVKDCNHQLLQQKFSTIPVMLKFFANTLGWNFSHIAYYISKNRVNVAGLTNFSVGLNDIRLEANNGKVLSVSLAAGLLGGITGVGFMAISCGENVYLTATAEASILSKTELDETLALARKEIDVLNDISKQK